MVICDQPFFSLSLSSMSFNLATTFIFLARQIIHNPDSFVFGELSLSFFISFYLFSRARRFAMVADKQAVSFDQIIESGNYLAQALTPD